MAHGRRARFAHLAAADVVVGWLQSADTLQAEVAKVAQKRSDRVLISVWDAVVDPEGHRTITLILELIVAHSSADLSKLLDATMVVVEW